MISVRQTKRSDWLVFQAIPATLGMGIEKVGTLVGGYTTGYQYDRFPTEQEANEYAKKLAEKLQAQVVKWEYKQRENPQFIDLTKLYPTEKEFNTSEKAKKAGWINISPNKRLCYYNDVRIWCKDVTLGTSFGYNLAIVANDKIYLESTEIWISGKFSQRFRTGDIVDTVEKIKQDINAS